MADHSSLENIGQRYNAQLKLLQEVASVKRERNLTKFLNQKFYQLKIMKRF